MKNRLLPVGEPTPSEAQVLTALVHFALSTGLWQEPDLKKFQAAFFHTMQQKVARYTMGDSTSVPIETAEQLQASVALTLGVSLKEQESPEQALKLLSGPLEPVLTDGLRRIQEMVTTGKTLLEKAHATRLHTNNRAYQDTMAALAGFFRQYNPVFLAQEIPCMIDYQLASPVDDLPGIFYINAYLERLILENSFCRPFLPLKYNALHRACFQDAKEDCVNLFEPVFANALGLTVAGVQTQITDLHIDDGVLASLCTMLTPLDSEMLLTRLLQSLDEMITILGLKLDEAEMGYFRQIVQQIVVRIQNTGINGLENIFISLNPNKNAPLSTTALLDAPGLDNEQLRQTITAVNSCKTIAERIEKTKESARSLQDMAELLNACFFGDELHAFYDSLNNTELTLLYDYADTAYSSGGSALPYWVIRLRQYLT